MNTYRLEDVETGEEIAAGVLSTDGRFETPVTLAPNRSYILKVRTDDGEERANEFALQFSATLTGTATGERDR